MLATRNSTYDSSIKQKELNNSVINTCILFLLLVSGCKPVSNQKKVFDLLNANVNSFIQTKTINQTELTLQLIPESLAFESGNTENTGEQHRRSMVAKLRLVVPSDRLTTRAKNYLNLGIRDRFYSVSGGDSMSRSFFERIPGIATNEYVYLISFSGEKPVEDWSLILIDDELGIGAVSFFFSKDTIKKLKEITN